MLTKRKYQLVSRSLRSAPPRSLRPSILLFVAISVLGCPALVISLGRIVRLKWCPILTLKHSVWRYPNCLRKSQWGGLTDYRPKQNGSTPAEPEAHQRIHLVRILPTYQRTAGLLTIAEPRLTMLPQSQLILTAFLTCTGT